MFSGDFPITAQVGLRNPVMLQVQFLLRILTVVALICACYFYKHSFFKDYFVSGAYNIVSGTNYVLAFQNLKLAEFQSSLGICSNAALLSSLYSYVSAGRRLQVNGCQTPSFEDIVQHDISTLFVPTLLKRTRTTRFPQILSEWNLATNESNIGQENLRCETLHNKACAEGASYTFYNASSDNVMRREQKEGYCECASADTSLLIGAEEIEVSIAHIASIMKRGSLFRSVQTPAKITIYGEKGTKKKFKDSELVTFKLADALAWMGLDLDIRIDQQPNKKWFKRDPKLLASPGAGPQYPKLRTAGLKIFMHFDYFDSEQTVNSIYDSILWDKRISKVDIQLYPVFQWTSRKNPPVEITTSTHQLSSTEWFGVEFEAVTHGSFTEVDGWKMFQSLLFVVMMMHISHQIPAYIHRTFYIPDALKRYAMKSSLDIRAEYACFATQAISAAVLFQLLDSKQDGFIEKRLIVRLLKETFGNALTSREYKQLVEMLSLKTCVDGSLEVVKGKVSKEEFIRLFTATSGDIRHVPGILSYTDVDHLVAFMEKQESKEHALVDFHEEKQSIALAKKLNEDGTGGYKNSSFRRMRDPFLVAASGENTMKELLDNRERIRAVEQTQREAEDMHDKAIDKIEAALAKLLRKEDGSFLLDPDGEHELDGFNPGFLLRSQSRRSLLSQTKRASFLTRQDLQASAEASKLVSHLRDDSLRVQSSQPSVTFSLPKREPSSQGVLGAVQRNDSQQSNGSQQSSVMSEDMSLNGYESRNVMGLDSLNGSKQERNYTQRITPEKFETGGKSEESDDWSSQSSLSDATTAV